MRICGNGSPTARSGRVATRSGALRFLRMAGGIKGGTIYGATDEYGYHAVENRVEMFDLHATVLYLLVWIMNA